MLKSRAYGAMNWETMYRTPSPDAYRESAVMTASPVQLVVMLYDGAHRFLQRALILHEQGQPIQAGVAVGRAQAIVEELLATIDIERGGEVAPRLQGIYVFCLSRMASAHFAQDPAPLREVMGLLGDLRDSWSEIAAAQN